ncbi:hypothetical protein NPX13_g1544 [Xylaria arbuscula]|uniref:Heterokaryon incompatibility domain-containing protein n=1 Tax=Xylaria arbuscula TaxID=114810 RepID=A0A9W8TR81_9PEZI|nr:hypothetical protein NPX13_g1544 [Xylaria arbuscula]
MHLINTQTLELREFQGASIPRYAILSHTWEQDEEVSYQEWQRRETDESIRTKSGFKKITNACRRAQGDSLEWLWVDTSCIDKTSSAELTEAINSMYGWYRESVVCYAYLCDVPAFAGSDKRQSMKRLRKSRWWTRGWTLQELLAPRRLLLFSRGWEMISDREFFVDEISDITGVMRDCLRGSATTLSASAAQKMSWLSKRQTTRVEDMAYCMLGLFGVNMPLLYGEGRKAFVRLQEEIIKISGDHTLFCWTWTDTVPPGWVSMLAPWPDTFADAGYYVVQHPLVPPKPYSMTNLGLSAQLPVIYTLTYWFLVLNVSCLPPMENTCVCVPVGSLIMTNEGLCRHHFPNSPMQLYRHAAERCQHTIEERLHSLMVTSQTRSAINSRLLHRDDMSEGYGVLLFVDPEGMDLFNYNSPYMPFSFGIRYHSSIIETEPDPNSFRHLISTAQLVPVKHGPNEVYATVISIQGKPFEQNSCFFVFFAVVNAATIKESWHRETASLMELENIFNPDGDLAQTKPMDWRVATYRKIWLRHMISASLQGLHDESLTKSKDGSLSLAMGKRLQTNSAVKVRPACLSCRGHRFLPIPNEEPKRFQDNSDARSI